MDILLRDYKIGEHESIKDTATTEVRMMAQGRRSAMSAQGSHCNLYSEYLPKLLKITSLTL